MNVMVCTKFRMINSMMKTVTGFTGMYAYGVLNMDLGRHDPAIRVDTNIQVLPKISSVVQRSDAKYTQ